MRFTVKQWELIIQSLDCAAHMEAGQSQAPDLINTEDTDEWKLARGIERRMANTEAIRKHKEKRAKRNADTLGPTNL